MDLILQLHTILKKDVDFMTKKYLLFCLVLFDKIIITSPSMFVYAKLVKLVLYIDNNFTTEI